MRALLVSLMIAFAAQVSTPNGTSPDVNPQKATAESNEANKQVQHETTPGIGASTQGSRTESNSSKSKQDKPAEYGTYEVNISSSPSADWWVKSYTIATIVGVCGGLVGLLVIWIQTKATRKAADAALLNAKAVINAERAWFLLEQLDPPHLVQNDYAYCLIHLRNYGKTPAKVIAQKFELQIGDNNIEPPVWPVRGETHVPDTIPPNNAGPWKADLPGILNNEKYSQLVTQRTKFLWLCGSVQYRDVFELDGDVHETYICYLYILLGDNPFWGSSGPQEYNKAT